MHKFLNLSLPSLFDVQQQKYFERNLCNLTAEALTPLSLCESPSFRKLVGDLDSRINHVSWGRLTRNPLPTYHSECKEGVVWELSTHISASIQFDLWMTRKTEEIFCINSNYKLSNVHIGMPYSSAGTDGQSLSLAVKDCMQEYNLCHKVVSYTNDGGSNLGTCKTALEENVDNTDVFSPRQPIFDQDCVAHILHDDHAVALGVCSILGCLQNCQIISRLSIFMCELILHVQYLTPLFPY